MIQIVDSKYLWLSFVVFLMFSALPVLADSSSQQYSKLFLSPFYLNAMSQGVPYTFSVDVKPSDGLSSVKSAIISFDVWMTPSVNFTLKVNNKDCRSPYYYISTTYSGSGKALINFDCGNVINSYGSYAVTLTPSRNTGALNGWLDLTYISNPLSMGFGGTEYTSGQNGTAFIRLLDGNSNPVNLASCNATAYYPNKTQFFRQNMSQLGSGYYYYDFVVPSIQGVYITGFDCLFPSTPWNSNVSLQGIVLDTGVLLDYSSFFFFDDTNNYTINSAYLNVSVTNSLAGSNVGVKLNGVTLGSLTGSGTVLGNYILNASNFVLGDAQSYTLSRDGTGVNTLNWIRLYVNYTYNSQPFMIRGQTELHVNPSPLSNITDVATVVWNAPVRNLTYYPAVNSTDLAVSVWNFSNRALTDYNQTDMLSRLDRNYNRTDDTFNSISSLSSSMGNNFSYTNGLIQNVNATLNYWGSRLETYINSTVASIVSYYYNQTIARIDYWGALTNATLANIEFKIDNLNTTLTNLTIGNVTLTVNVDERAIAVDTLRIFCYYGAIDIWDSDICRSINERGVMT